MDIAAVLVTTAGRNTTNNSTGMDGDAHASIAAAEAHIAGLIAAHKLATSTSVLRADTEQPQDKDQSSGSEWAGSESSTSEDDEPDTTSISDENSS
jgi:hypothetical protein